MARWCWNTGGGALSVNEKLSVETRELERGLSGGSFQLLHRAKSHVRSTGGARHSTILVVEDPDSPASDHEEQLFH